MSHPESRRNWGGIAAFAVLCAAAVLALLVWTGKVAGGKPECGVCKREIRSEVYFKIAGQDGSVKRTCCPRCGLVSLQQQGGRALEAIDFVSRKPVDPFQAVYLEGSDIMACCSGMGFRTGEGTYRDMAYDRCLPSLIAFARRKDAEDVQRVHGGTIRGLTALIPANK